jgi:hypothetical protein
VCDSVLATDAVGLTCTKSNTFSRREVDLHNVAKINIYGHLSWLKGSYKPLISYLIVVLGARNE